MEVFDEKEAAEFRKASGYFQHKSQRLFSMTLKEFLEFMEEKVQTGQFSVKH